MLLILTYLMAIPTGIFIVFYWCIGMPSSINKTILYYDKQKKSGYKSNSLTPIFLCLYFIFSVATFWIWCWGEFRNVLNNEPSIFDHLDFTTNLD